jgi:hypothetical protein
MKHLGIALLIVLLILPAVAGAEKAKTIDELAKMYDSARCKECHAEIYAQWERSHHARSLMGVQDGLMMAPLAMKGKTPFSPDDPKKATLKTFPCFKCHLPQALTSGTDAVAAEYAQALVAGDKAKVSKLNIGCVVCHNDKAIVHKLTDGFPEKDVLYSTKEVASHPDSVYKSVKKSLTMDHAVHCGQCHGLGPNFEFDNPIQCANLYGSYEHNYISKGGEKQCQECHMKQANGVADHRLLPDWNDHELTAQLLKEAISLDVDTLAYDWLRKANDYHPLVVVNTKIRTTAGHRIPDG